MKQESFPYINNPYGFKFPEPKIAIHPLVSEWDDLPNFKKEKLIEIKNKIHEITGDCKIKLFGSTVKGTWDENSDFDLCLEYTYKDKIDKIRTIDFGIKVDIVLTHNIEISEGIFI